MCRYATLQDRGAYEDGSEGSSGMDPEISKACAYSGEADHRFRLMPITTRSEATQGLIIVPSDRHESSLRTFYASILLLN